MPLIAAFLHIQQVAGGEELAEEELRQRLESGDVEALERRVTQGKGTDTITPAPEDFQNGPLFPRHPEHISDLHREAHRRDNLLRRVERLGSDGRYFFLRRAHVYRVWPSAADDTDKPQQTALPATRPKGIGHKVWLAANKVWELWCEGYQWPDREQLLRKVRKRIGDERLSLRTLDEALAYLRKKRLIDR
jgi:hypothetical protein